MEGTKTKPEEKKKGLLGKLKEHAEDKEEQLAILSTFVRLSVLIWSAGILTLAYVKLPEALKIPEQKLDPTFIASVFTGTLALLASRQQVRKRMERTVVVVLLLLNRIWSFLFRKHLKLHLLKLLGSNLVP